MINRILCLLACAPLLLFSGCTAKDGVTVNIVNVRLTDVTPLETTATFTLRFSNEKPEPVRITGGVHKIYLNGLYVGKGLSSDALEIPRLTTSTQAVVVHLNNIALATRVKPMIESKSFDYRMQSTLYGKSWASRMKSVSEGKLEAKDFMPDSETNTVPEQVSEPVQ
jgi:LEA14-like dessication related protein